VADALAVRGTLAGGWRETAAEASRVRWQDGRVRLRITTKLFLVVFAMAAAVVVAMGAAGHFSLTRGFLGYVNELSLQHMDATVPRVAAAYQEHGSWDFLHEEPRIWLQLLNPRIRPFRDHGRPPEPPPPGGMPIDELTGAMLRWTLLDAQHRRITGYPEMQADAVERPVVVGGQTVGYMAMTPFQSVAATGAQRFERSQLKASLGVGALALAVSALIAGWMSAALLRPVQRVAQATGRLAAGEYDTRVAVRGHDEVAALAADFNHLAQTLQQNAAVRRSFFTDVSHELRTPLAVLQGELEAIEDGVRPLTREAVQSLLGEVHGLSRLVGDLHHLALAGAGSLGYRMEPTDVTGVLGDCAAAFRTRVREHGLGLELQVPDESLQVQGDPARLRQVFHNLLENAIRYTDAGGRIEVRALREPGEVVVQIQDSAPGVADADLPLLFERFYRADLPGARPTGSGLGLAICRAVAEAHRGTVHATASPLGGVRVTLRLPALD
jgi:two-component system sensor histidine kinase BaeS